MPRKQHSYLHIHPELLVRVWGGGRGCEDEVVASGEVRGYSSWYGSSRSEGPGGDVGAFSSGHVHVQVR